MPEDFGTTIVVPKPEGAFFGGRGKDQRPPSDPQSLEHWILELAREEREAVRRGRERDARKRRKGKGPGKRRTRQLDEARARRTRNARTTGPERPTRSVLPDTVEIRVAPPPGYEGLPIEEVRRIFRELLEAETQQVHAERHADGKRSFMGLEAVLAQNPFDSAGPTRPTFETIPRVACTGDTDRRIAILEGLQDWRARYRKAWEAYDDPEAPDLPFPEGTYLMAKRFRVLVEQSTGPPVRMAA